MPHQTSFHELPRIPLEHATLGEVLTRVSYRLLQIAYHRAPPPIGQHRMFYTRIADDLAAGGFPQIAEWMRSAQYETRRRGFTLSDYCSLIVNRLRLAKHGYLSLDE
jgi:hypothetical protein